jgi:tRNA nucleotidyltransferase (CCA-adding enzyme)
MVEVQLLVPRRIWAQIERYAQEAATRAQQHGADPAAVALLTDPQRMAAVLLEQLVENEERVRALAKPGARG